MGKRKHAEPADAVEPAPADKELEAAAAAAASDGADDDEGGSDMPSDGEDDSGGSSGSSDGDSSSGPEVSDDPGEAEPSDDPDAFDKIDVSFQFFDPKESDFHGLKALLHNYLDGQQYDGSALVDAIIAQSTVGTVVRTAEEDDPIAVMSVLNTAQHAAAPFMGQVRDYVLGKCRDGAVKQQLSKAWSGPSTGLLINERLINCPPQLAPPLVQALFSEIEWATEDEPTQERRAAFAFKHYVLMTRVYADPLPQEQQQQQQAAGAGAAAAGGSSGSKAGRPPAGPPKPPKGPQQQPAKKQKRQQDGQATAASSGPVIVYVRPEDEFLHQQAAASFTFPVEGRAVAKDELQPMRLVLLLPASKVAAARAALDAVVGNMAAQQ